MFRYRASWSLDDALLLVCFVPVLVIARSGPLAPRRSWGRLLLLSMIRRCATKVWAMEAATALGHDAALGAQAPFWLTLVPQLCCCSVCLLALAAFGGLTALPSAFWTDGAMWACGGAAFFFGQYFTVQSLGLDCSMVTLVGVKVLEPVTTALLAIPVLQGRFNAPLFLGLCVSCGGAMLTIGCAYHRWQGASVVTVTAAFFAVMANTGYSLRSCAVKKMMKGIEPLTAFGVLSSCSLVLGMLPLCAWGPLGMLTGTKIVGFEVIFAVPFRAWYRMACSYTLCQMCSVLVLSALAVETYALLVCLEHLVVALLAFQVRLTGGPVAGLAIAACGAGLYVHAEQQREGEARLMEALEQSQAASVKGAAAGGLKPVSAFAFITALALLLVGTAVPLGAAVRAGPARVAA